MFFIASHFQLPPVSERFHGNYRQPQQSGSHRSDHKVTPADTCTYNQPPAARGTRVSHSDLSFGALQFIGCCELLRFPVFCWTHTFFLHLFRLRLFWLHTPFRQRPDYQHTTPSVWASPESHTVTIGNTGYTGITGNLLSCNRLPASPRSWRLITDQTNLSSVS